MKKFHYKAKKGPQKVIEGVIYANSAREVVEKINKTGYVATSVREELVQSDVRATSFDFNSLFGVGIKELISFTKQLATLIKSGIPILKSLTVLGEQTQDRYFRTAVESIAENVKNGHSLSSSLKEYPKIFSPFYRAMLKAGEESGKLPMALKRISDYYSKRYEFVSKVRIALAYPMLILIVGFLTLIFVFTNVLPRIIPVIINLKMDLPIPTKILIALTMFLTHNWVWVILTVVLLLLIMNRAVKNENFNYYFSHFKMNLPVFGEIIMKSETAQFSRAMSMALSSGISIIQSVNICVPILNEYGIINAVNSSLKQLEAGGSFGEALKNTKVFPPFVYNLIKIGEESGNLEESLTNIAETYEEDCEEALKVMTNLIEPILVLVVGLIVGFIVVAVLLPVFNINVASY
ncbi:MAG: type II secretion system F family protein [Candidatus Omnitrophica bacterium]|nr:type II secretion system F family protein [Candidatus Omnitrophota bacterium]